MGTFKPIYVDASAKFYVFGPSHRSEQFGFDGPLLSWHEWRDGRMANCRVNGQRVGPVKFRKIRAEIKRRR